MIGSGHYAFDPGFVEDLKSINESIHKILDNVRKRIVGQDLLVKRLVETLLVGGHVLLEGVPGLAKTLSIKTLANSVDGSFQRIQFTPDLLPADVVGTEIFRPRDGTFEVRKGPVFANFVLADEINRAPAKVQSALLETMQEYQVTIGESSFEVPHPFFVLATQNPIEQEGTYPLPEAQVDRFTIKVRVGYPSLADEKEILDLVTGKNYQTGALAPVVPLGQIAKAQELCRRIYVDERVRQYIVNIIGATRNPQDFGVKVGSLIELGASPRGTIALLQMARAEALLAGEHFVVPQNVKDVALDVLRHRVVPTYEAEAQGLTSEDLVSRILDGVDVP